MTGKKPPLDKGTIDLVKRVFALPPKHHDEMKVGRTKEKKKRDTKGRASSAKRRNA